MKFQKFALFVCLVALLKSVNSLPTNNQNLLNLKATSCSININTEPNEKLEDVILGMKQQLDEIQDELRNLTKKLDSGKAESLSVTICEGSRKAISCKNGKKLNIQEALYGRLNRETCNRLPIRSTNCRSARSLPVMQSRCQGRASCVLNASNSVFGDPCHGTVKYLLVKFQCIE